MASAPVVEYSSGMKQFIGTAVITVFRDASYGRLKRIPRRIGMR